MTGQNNNINPKHSASYIEVTFSLIKASLDYILRLFDSFIFNKNIRIVIWWNVGPYAWWVRDIPLSFWTTNQAEVLLLNETAKIPVAFLPAVTTS